MICFIHVRNEKQDDKETRVYIYVGYSFWSRTAVKPEAFAFPYRYDKKAREDPLIKIKSLKNAVRFKQFMLS